jgi:hypothetical protein
MIKANELRIGNCVILHTENYPDCNYPIGYIDIGVVSIKPERFSPIPLTPEILLKCRFKLFPWGWIKNDEADKRSLRITKHFNFERDGQTSLEIKTLHQLQNLYYALTGEELIYKP